MNIIKLDAIGSTNTFLKELVSSSRVENYTIVSAETQLDGRGQMGAKWISEKGKNLLFSVLVEVDSFEVSSAFYLNYCVSLAVVKALNTYDLPRLKIKWPNDILAESKKISGILIENSFSGKLIKHSIIGIGLNVNQIDFDLGLKNVTSIKNIIDKNVDKDKLLEEIVMHLKMEIENCKEANFGVIKERYLNVLYKKEIPTMFKDSEDAIFLGKITNVTDSGKLQIELEDASIREFGIKEIQFLKNL